MIMALLRLILPIKPILDLVDLVNQTMFHLFCYNNAFLINLTNKVKWDIQGIDKVKVKGSCVIICNHMSWADIVMLCHLYRGRIPITKFFLKHSLIYIPLIGQICYAVGMPFLRRYTRSQILKNPKLKTKDLDATRKACQSLLKYPSSLVNFVEGTRYTEAKAAAQKSPYMNLMPPKAASLAVALGIIGKNIDCMLNTTMLYPENKSGTNIFFSLLCGRLTSFVARVEIIDKQTIEQSLVGDYLADKQFKRNFTNYLRDVWQQKDEQIASILGKEYCRPNFAESKSDSAEAAPSKETEDTATQEQVKEEQGAASEVKSDAASQNPSEVQLEQAQQEKVK